MSNHRREVRPRYGRIAALSTALTVTVVAALAGLGVFTSSTANAGAKADSAAYTSPAAPSSTPTIEARPLTSTTDQATPRGSAAWSGRPWPSLRTAATGRRVVFSQALQRVWLVDASERVKRSYLVSGSVTANLQPGTYSVYSRSRWAVGVDDSGVMQYFVRFTQGPTGAAIGFHDHPDAERRTAADRGAAGHAAVARLHPAAHARRDRAVELRARRHQGRRRRLSGAATPRLRPGSVNPGYDDGGAGCGCATGLRDAPRRRSRWRPW